MCIRNRMGSPPRKTLGTFFLTLFCIWSVMFLCNLLTPYIADDFSYRLNFATGKRLQSVRDIVQSMAYHRNHVNGRILAHTIVQIFSMFPAWLFDIVNALVFILFILGMVRISEANGNQLFIALFAFSAAWLVCPAFGQVFLWQDGSINYLWAFLPVTIYLIPFVDYLLNGKTIDNRILKGIYLFFAVVMGAYTEVASFGAIVASFLLLLVNRLYCGEKNKSFFCLMIAFACIGYISIYLAPAQWLNKSHNDNHTVASLIEALFRVLHGYQNLLPLLASYAVLLIVSIWAQIDRKRILVSLAFIVASLAANSLMFVAVDYPGRAGSGVFIHTLIANVLLLTALLNRENLRMLLTCALAVILLITASALLDGTEDIISTKAQIQRNAEIIAWYKSTGDTNVAVPIIRTDTKYSALNGLMYLSAQEANTWPNTAMAKYYKVNSIIGYYE